MRAFVLLCLVAGAFAACDIACEDNKAPVCGSDGVTYLNVCYLKVTACKYAEAGKTLTLAYNGECGANTKPYVVDPVVGTGSVSVTGTDCAMRCDSTDKYPICGTDGVTYANKCEFYQAKCKYDSAGIRFDIANLGECRSASATLTGNTGSLTGSTFTADRCSADNFRCDSTPTRICGSDGNVYGSQCEFLKVKCFRDSTLTVVTCRSALTASALAGRR